MANQNYTSSELLHLYIDGELEPALEGDLFGALAADSELRVELRDTTALRQAIHADSLRLAPRQAVHLGLMAQVDSELGIVSGGFSAVSGLGRFLSGGVARVALPIVTAVVGLLIGGFLLSGPSEDPFLSNAGRQLASAIPQYARAQEHGGAEQRHQGTRATVEAGRSFANRAPGTTTARPRVSYRMLSRRDIRNNRQPPQNRTSFADASLHAVGTKNQTPADGSVHDTLETPNISLVSPLGEASYVASRAPILTMDSTELHIASSAAGLDLADFESSLSGISIGTRRFSSRSFPASTVPTNGDPFVNTMALSLSVDIGGGHGVGVEFGNESFAQKFSRIENGIGVHYEQNPHTAWGGVMYRYRATSIDVLGGLAPTLQVTLGASGLGPMARALVGIEYAPLDVLSLMVGVEGGTLFYRNENAWYTTQTLGVTYGARVRL